MDGPLPVFQVPLGRFRHSDQVMYQMREEVALQVLACCTDVEALEAMEATLAEPRCRCPAPFEVENWFWNFLVLNQYDIVRFHNSMGSLFMTGVF